MTKGSSVSVGDGLTVWVWAGGLGDKVGSGTELFVVSVVKEAAPSVAPTAAAITTDLPKQPDKSDVDRAHFGRTVTVTIQLKGEPDGGDAADAGDDVDTVPSKAGGDPPKYSVVVVTHNTPPGNDATVPAASTDNDLSQETRELTIGADGIADVGSTCADEDECADVMVHWVAATTARAQASNVAVLALDADNHEIVVDLQTNSAVTPTWVNYDGNDFFTVTTVADGADAIFYLGSDGFEAALAKALKARADDPGSNQAPMLQWAGYVHDDSSTRTSFTLDATPS